MKKLIVALFIAICWSVVAFGARYEGFTSANSVNTPLKVVVDAVECRPDLTRVYARFVGQPHTSNRVDAITLVIGGKSYTSTDIDGVDLKRYFQWEDTPDIKVEIDFPALKKMLKKFEIKSVTPRGESVTRVSQKKR